MRKKIYIVEFKLTADHSAPGKTFFADTPYYHRVEGINEEEARDACKRHMHLKYGIKNIKIINITYG